MSNKISIDKILTEEILPTLPAVAVKVLSLQPDTSAAEMARVITQDTSLSTRILKAANSPYSAPKSPVGNVKRAVAVLGNRQVRTLSLAFSLVPIQNSILDFSRFWEHSLAVGIGTRRILKLTNPRQSEDGFTVGLLADIGMVLLAGTHPTKYKAVLVGSLVENGDTKTIEREIFGFDHIELGAAAARLWRFPDIFQAVISHHHNPRAFRGGESVLQHIQAVYLAGVLADVFYSSKLEELKTRFQQTTQQVPVFSNLSFEDILKGVGDETQEVAQWMGIHIESKRSIAEILETANKKLVGISGEYEEAIEWIYRTHVDKVRISKDSSPEGV